MWWVSNCKKYNYSILLHWYCGDQRKVFSDMFSGRASIIVGLQLHAIVSVIHHWQLCKDYFNFCDPLSLRALVRSVRFWWPWSWWPCPLPCPIQCWSKPSTSLSLTVSESSLGDWWKDVDDFPEVMLSHLVWLVKWCRSLKCYTPIQKTPGTTSTVQC